MRYINLWNLGLVLAVTLLINSCCNEQDDNSGYIISDFKITNFDDNSDFDCYDFADTICIRDDSTYRKTFAVAKESKCRDLTLPYVDFKSNSILVHKMYGGRTFYHRTVQIDSINKIVTYLITTTGCFCPDKCIRDSYNMVLVPKISNDYKIEYK